LPYDKVSCYSLPQEALRECSTDQHVNQITLSVKDESGELFDFKGLPLEFVLELNSTNICMSSANVLTPTAPPELYPQVTDLRMQKINKISAAMSGEVSH